MRQASRALFAFSVALSVAVAGAGCTSQRGGSSGGATSSASASHLTGTPITLGFVTVENSALGSYPETRRAAQAAVDRANSALDGVGGHPLKLVTCATDGSPESSQNCANTLVAAKPVAVVGGIDFGTQAAMPIYESAHIPYVTGSPQLSGELDSKNAFALSGGSVAELLGITEYLTSTKHIRSAHALYVDLPGLLTAAIQGSQNILRKKGVTDVKLIAEKADAADFAPAVTQAAAGNPDAIIVVFQAAACARIAQAAASLNVRSDIYFVGACATPAVPRAAAGHTQNLYFASSYLPVTTSGGDADVAAFRAAVPENDRTSASQGAFSTVLDVRALLAKTPQSTPAALTATLRATQNEPNVMAHPYTCDGKQLSIFPAVCNSAVRLLHWQGSSFTDVTGTWQDGRQLIGLIN
ncbi:ABC-type branched-chain amino acid transport system, periplasmic component [Frankia sp. AiPs1]|uniref:ABC transporter substrate-binding protein n=1 Tax=Frankia sp. AiPa1 TaxID=573492 RepID=UPI00202B862D|nr:ABC transporter substrate-binding protein [Frankia sp. AiPa1]MCL9762150.1 ABC transporter substrate-binding protein [Frankia sp. AiPa1]